MKNCEPLVLMQLNPKLGEFWQVLGSRLRCKIDPPKTLAVVGECVSPLVEHFI
jgi:hypothetical protein